MSLAGIRFLQDRDERTNFDWSHANEHLAIAQAIQSQLGITIPVPPLHPVGDNEQSWALLHQSVHDAMNKALSTAGKDLSDGVFSPDWISQNYMEHVAVKTVLNI